MAPNCGVKLLRGSGETTPNRGDHPHTFRDYTTAFNSSNFQQASFSHARSSRNSRPGEGRDTYTVSRYRSASSFVNLVASVR